MWPVRGQATGLRRRVRWLTNQSRASAQLANMFAVVLIVAAGLTFLIYFLSSPRDTANLVLAFGILGVVLLFALRVVTGNPVALWFVFALGVMVALVPEGLPATLVWRDNGSAAGWNSIEAPWRTKQILVDRFIYQGIHHAPRRLRRI